MLMTQFDKDLVISQARRFGGKIPSEARATELAEHLNTLINALDMVSIDLPLEAEPADMARTLEELARD